MAEDALSVAARLRQTVAKEGLLGLYKGVTPPLLMTGFINAALFGLQVPILHCATPSLG